MQKCIVVGLIIIYSPVNNATKIELKHYHVSALGHDVIGTENS
jgi:hypothetical protein